MYICIVARGDFWTRSLIAIRHLDDRLGIFGPGAVSRVQSSHKEVASISCVSWFLPLRTLDVYNVFSC